MFFYGDGRSVRGDKQKQMTTRKTHAWTTLPFAQLPLAKASHVAKPSNTEGKQYWKNSKSHDKKYGYKGKAAKLRRGMLLSTCIYWDIYRLCLPPLVPYAIILIDFSIVETSLHVWEKPCSSWSIIIGIIKWLILIF